jgi:hypothetical protein
MLTHQTQLVFHQRVFYLNDLHDSSPIKALTTKKIGGLYRFLRIPPLAMADSV